ncbi:hypothetical protein L2E82_11108 [Cichorium intybus]|uniref:Uncharacterized protein n=1 Tax=Cichorium intybus TaxID=13427 RepID=A0ACB9GED7_CICIN|nr:hypothetical protein L2E82_11108 [Cichorium intybus]
MLLKQLDVVRGLSKTKEEPKRDPPIPIALDMAKDFKGKQDAELFRKITSDEYMRILQHIFQEIETSIQQQTFLSKFRMSELPSISDKLETLLDHLQADNVDAEIYAFQIISVLRDIMEIITKEVMFYRSE